MDAAVKQKRPTKQEINEHLKKIAKFLDRNIAQYHMPTLRDAYNYALDNQIPLKRAQISRFMRENYEEYAKTLFNQQRIKYPLRVALAYLGVVGVDLIFPGRTSAFKYYNVIGPKIYCFLSAICFLSKQIFLFPVPRGKTFQNLKGPLEKLIQSYQTAKGVAIKSIASDREKALMSFAGQEFFKSHHINHFAYELSSRKNAITENANLLIRQEWACIVHHYPNMKDSDIAVAVTNSINQRPVLFDNGKQSSFTRENVTKRTVQRFLRERKRKQSGDFWGFVRIDPNKVTFKYPIGTKVRLFKKLVDMPNPLVKRSENSVTSRVYVIAKQGAYLRDGFVKKYYLVKKANETSVEDRSYVAYEESMQKVS